MTKQSVNRLSYHQRLWQAGLLLFLMLTLLFLARIELQPKSQTIEISEGQTEIILTLDRSQQLTADTCPKLIWQSDQIEAFYLNDEGRPGFGEELLCNTNQARVEIWLPDGSTMVQTLESHIFFKSPAGFMTLAWVSLLIYFILLSFNLLPGPIDFFQTYKNLAKDLYHDSIQTWHSLSHIQKTILILTILGGFVLRLIYITQPIRYDEAMTLRLFAHPSISLAEGLSSYSIPNNHPLNTFFINLITNLIGQTTPWVLRIHTLIFGTLLIPMGFICARALYNTQTALFSTGLIAVFGPFILYSVNARGYMPQILIVVILVWCITRLLRTSDRRLWLFFIVLTALGFYAVPTMLYPFAGITLWFIISLIIEPGLQQRIQLLRDLILSSGLAVWLILLLYMPIFANEGLNAIINNPSTRRMDWLNFTQRWSNAPLILQDLWFDAIPLSIAVTLSIGLLTSLICHRYISVWRLPVWLSFIMALFIILPIQRPAVFGVGRILLYLLPFLLISVAAGLLALLRRARIATRLANMTVALLCVVIALNIIVSGMPYLNPDTGILPDAPDIIDKIQQTDFDADTTLLIAPRDTEEILSYYLSRARLPQLHLQMPENPDNTFIISDKTLLAETLSQYNLSTEDTELLADFSSTSLYQITKPD